MNDVEISDSHYFLSFIFYILRKAILPHSDCLWPDRQFVKLLNSNIILCIFKKF